MTLASQRQQEYILRLANDAEPGSYRWIRDVAAHPACALSKGQLGRLDTVQAHSLIEQLLRWNERHPEEPPPPASERGSVAERAAAWRDAEAALVEAVRRGHSDGATKTGLARAAGVSVAQVNRWLTG